MTVVPPIKSQGIKTKLAPWIVATIQDKAYDRWIEPFMGTGAVAFNVRPRSALLCDSNPHIIHFYNAIKARKITPQLAKKFLTSEGEKLCKSDGEHYYIVRERFNKHHAPLDFLFLSRSCFNGMIRFNKKGGFNVPFCRKPKRFAQALITKITNQIDCISSIIEAGDYEFCHQDFTETLASVSHKDMVYCDPPYIGRHVDYFNSWSEEDEKNLHRYLAKSGARFILSTWLKNKYRNNDYVFDLWGECSILIREHFYHVGAKERNRNSIYEALLINFDAENAVRVPDILVEGGQLLKPGQNPFLSQQKELLRHVG